MRDYGEIVYWVIAVFDLLFIISVIKLNWLPFHIGYPISVVLVFVAWFFAIIAHKHQKRGEKNND